MFVVEWMVRDVVTIGRDETIAVAARVLAKHHIRQLPVVEKGNLVGLLTKSNLLRASPPDLNPFSLAAAVSDELSRPVHQIMITDVVTVGPEAPLEQAALVLIDRRINALPVVKGVHLLGILTGQDISRALLAALGAGKPGVRITFEVAGGEDVFASIGPLAAHRQVHVRSVTTFEHEGKHIGIVRLDEEHAAFLDDLWKSGHRVVSVARFG